MAATFEEQSMLAESARDFLAARASVRDLRRLRDASDPLGLERDAWRELGALGYAGMLVDEGFGGSAFGFGGAGVVCAEIGRQLSPLPFVSTAVMGAVALRAATRARQDHWLARIAKGEAVVALAVDEGRRHAPEGTALAATRDGDGHRLQGTKTFVADGPAADLFVVLARTSGAPGATDGLSLFLVEAGCPRLAVERIDTIDSRGAARLRFDGVHVGADDAVGPLGGAWPVLDDILDAGRIALAAELSGIAQALFERTLAYLKQRQQFGRAIGSFQALQHRAARLHCQIELAQSVVLKAGQLRDDGDRRAPLFASVAKAKAGEAAELAAGEAVQMHGGIGMTDELDVGLFLKRARVAGSLLGDRHFHADRAASLLGF